MDLFELLIAIAVWVVFSVLGFRKKAARQAPVEDESSWPEWEALDEAEPAAPPEEPVAETEPSRPAAPVDLRDLIRQLKEGLAPPVEPPEPPPRPEPTRPARSEPLPPPPELPELPEPIVTIAPPPRSRRGWLARELSSGSESLARAIVLREVLGPPVALRASDEPDRWGT